MNIISYKKYPIRVYETRVIQRFNWYGPDTDIIFTYSVKTEHETKAFNSLKEAEQFIDKVTHNENYKDKLEKLVEE